MGIFLIGGKDAMSKKSTELVMMNTNVSVQGFPLKYQTSGACSIELEEEVIVAGGHHTAAIVSVYNINGWDRDLPNLNQGRISPACGHYVTDYNELVGE